MVMVTLFFFKQKTAYEMRISDWSSDVCSSDLRLYLYALAAAGEAGVDRAVRLLRAEIERGMKLMGAKNLADLGRDNLRWRYFQIGRASCRERVCQYV